ncbi:MAG TPA: class I SAM-dependent methyltransferase [Gaiellaceae bacterium]|nr:class I SAM-dependent methyltransferase [Gaiellaceae bacterium]
MLHRLTGRPRAELGAYLDEVGAGSALLAHIDAAEDEYRRLSPAFALGPGTEPTGNRAVLYALVRALRPERVIETGTANGVSTAFLLAGLERNGSGRLLSIDLPFADAGGTIAPIVPGTEIDPDDATPVAAGREPGWIVPQELRGRWELRLGDALELLPRALADDGELGLFLHDSLHSRSHMLFEFEAAWPRLRSGGVLAADDIFQRKHDALPAFARSVACPWLSFCGMGFVVKP